jgi:hypothetical protein
MDRLDVSPAAINERIVNDLKKQWGGRLPTWDEFKTSHRNGRVNANKMVASRAISLSGMPRACYYWYGIIMPWAMFLIPIISIVSYLLGHGNVWIVAGSFVVSYALFKYTAAGSCSSMLNGAVANETLYQFLVSNGAFLFGPTSQEKR